jgi:hypothetical protein
MAFPMASGSVTSAQWFDARPGERDILMLRLARSGQLLAQHEAEVVKLLGPPDHTEMVAWYALTSTNDDLAMGLVLDCNNKVRTCQLRGLTEGSPKAPFSIEDWTSGDKAAVANGLVASGELVGQRFEVVQRTLGAPASVEPFRMWYYGRTDEGGRRYHGKKLILTFGSSRVQRTEYAGS